MVLYSLMFPVYTTRGASFGGPYCVSPTFGAPVCLITSQYKAGGVVFGAAIPGVVNRSVSLVLDGGVLASWVGVNAGNTLDLLTQVNCQIVVPGTTQQGTTDTISIEAGLSAIGNLQLSVYDINGVLLASRLNGPDGLGPDGRSIIQLGVNSFSGIPIPGAAFFSVGNSPAGIIASDTFALNEVDLNDITGVAVAGVNVPPFVNWVPFPAGPLCGDCPGDLGILRRLKNRLYYALTKGPVRLE